MDGGRGVSALVQRLTWLVGRAEAAAALRAGASEAIGDRLTQAVTVLRTDYPVAGSETTGVDPFSGLGEVFGLDPVDQSLLLIATAPDLDANVSTVFGLLRGGSGPARATVGLALELCGLPTLSGEGVARLGPAGDLRRHGLVVLTADMPWLSRELVVPDRVLAHLLGVDELEPDVAALVIEPIPLALDGAATLARAIEGGIGFSWVRAPIGTAGISVAAAAFRSVGLECLCLDVDRLPAGVDVRPVLRSGTREAALRGRGLVVGGCDRLGESGRAGSFDVLRDAAVPVVAVGERPWHRNWLAEYPFTLDAPVVRPADRDVAWQLAGGSELPREGLAGLRLTPEMIGDTARYSVALSSATGVPVSAELVRYAARRVAGSVPGSDFQPSLGAGRATVGFDDLVLPDHIMSVLLRLVAWGNGREGLQSVDAKPHPAGMGAGIVALFSGSPGTGKTLAAHVIADELGLDLFQIDLSTIVDKYIGETEKNLERVFHAAESLNVVLFFDEADALFGKRSDVKDAHDRYANQEVAYLLQRIETFDGITILATNLRGNVDPAFSRRMTFIVNFPDPDEPTRQRLWSTHLARLGAQDPDDPIDVAQLARSVELAGGDVRNIVMAVGYDAAAAGERPGMRHVVSATVAEYAKLGRRMPAALA